MSRRYIPSHRIIIINGLRAVPGKIARVAGNTDEERGVDRLNGGHELGLEAATRCECPLVAIRQCGIPQNLMFTITGPDKTEGQTVLNFLDKVFEMFGHGAIAVEWLILGYLGYYEDGICVCVCVCHCLSKLSNSIKGIGVLSILLPMLFSYVE